MGPFDDQLILDLRESGTYTNLAGSTATITNATFQEIGVQTLIAGILSLVARDARIASGKTQQPTRPAEGGTWTRPDGTVWQIVSVVARDLAGFWDMTVRSFAVPGGLTETGFIARRTNTETAEGLPSPTWSNIAGSTPCRVVADDQDYSTDADTAVHTEIRSRVAMQGYREMRAGDRFNTGEATTTYWTVVSAEPYDTSLGVQIFRITRRI